MFCLCYGALQVQVSLSTRAAVSTEFLMMYVYLTILLPDRDCNCIVMSNKMLFELDVVQTHEAPPNTSNC